MLIFEILFEKSGCESRIMNFQEIDNLMVIMVLLYVMVLYMCSVCAEGIHR